MSEPTDEQIEEMEDARLNGLIEEHEEAKRDPSLAEALSTLGERDYLVPHDIEWDDEVEQGYHAWLEVTDAARILLAGQDISWCETHRCAVRSGDACSYFLAASRLASSPPCSIVPARLILEPTLVKDFTKSSH
jgi:hypothetical protein